MRTTANRVGWEVYWDVSRTAAQTVSHEIGGDAVGGKVEGRDVALPVVGDWHLAVAQTWNHPFAPGSTMMRRSVSVPQARCARTRSLVPWPPRLRPPPGPTLTGVGKALICIFVCK